MNTALEQQSVASTMDALGKAARTAAAGLARTASDRRDEALSRAAAAIRSQSAVILSANAEDMRAAEAKGLTGAMLDRLLLNNERVESMACGLEAGQGACGMGAAKRVENSACVGAARRHRNHLRKPAKCYCGRGGPVPEIG